MARREKGTRPKLPPVSAEMRRTFALLGEEVAAWPDVSMRPMFGLRAACRRGRIFAMLPDKRSFEVVDALAYKENGKWTEFEVKNEEGIAAALIILQKAYQRIADFSEPRPAGASLPKDPV